MAAYFTSVSRQGRFSAVLNAPKLAQYPPGKGRWTTWVDGMKVMPGVDSKFLD